jgi:HAD superfamily phosphatase
VKYIELKNGNGTTYIREDRVSQLATVDTIVFDCDGVLLDVRNAYNVAIAATTRYIIEALTGTVIPETIFDSTLNHSYKRTGGFNNDWAHAYALIMRILAEVPEEKLAELNAYAEESVVYEQPRQRFKCIDGKIKADIPIEGLYEKLMEFAAQLDATGVQRVDELLLDKVGANIKQAFKFKGEVGESVISTLFEELFLGEQPFTETFGYPPQFVRPETGLVEADEVVIRPEAITELTELLGGARFGVASGSIENTAKHALGAVIDSFPQESQYWHDVVDREQKRLGLTDLHKPNPYPLLKAAEPFNPVMVLYIGDTMADYLTAENAGEKTLFTGVYASVHMSENVMESFLELGSDLVAPTVNDIPAALRYARRYN